MLEGGSSRSYLHAMRVECQVSHIMFECGAERREHAMSDEQHSSAQRNLAESAAGRRSDGKLPNMWRWHGTCMQAILPTCTVPVGRYGGLALICIVLYYF